MQNGDFAEDILGEFYCIMKVVSLVDESESNPNLPNASSSNSSMNSPNSKQNFLKNFIQLTPQKNNTAKVSS